ncbi:MAG: RluA family pseudouridine synthase [Lachnospiraceae bacterium]|nr:RluA family pseudouridine synthase [Lachnospiraceae bacterium]
MNHVKCEPGAHRLPDDSCTAGAHSLPVVYEDEDILVVNKPAGLPIHPSQNHYEDSLANAVMAYYKEQGENFVFRCINRLDRNTSGLTLIAKNMLSSAILSQDVMKRDIHRTYLALVERKGQEKTKVAQQLPDSGTIEAPIARVEGSTILREVNFETGDYALTKYWKLADFEDATLLKLQLGTGRTHQIRVHMSYIGHPLLGDDLYGNGTYQKIDSEGKPIILNRHALHSYRLEFTHPITGEAMDLKADLPADMKIFKGTIASEYGIY